MTQAILLAVLVGGVVLIMTRLAARNPVLLRLGLRNTTRRLPSRGPSWPVWRFRQSCAKLVGQGTLTQQQADQRVQTA